MNFSMKKIVIFGNSGSGKSTLAKKLNMQFNIAHYDLDNIAWLPTSPPERMPLDQSIKAIEAFTDQNEGWVIEGCYGDLLELVLPAATEVIFLNLPIERCIENARNRPWEAHKYKSKQEQDANLENLINWIQEYESRDDIFSN